MKKLLLTGIVLGCAASWTVHAQDVGGRKGLTDEEAQQRNALIEKYDTDGDGILSKTEQKKLSKADKKALAKTGGVGTARKTRDREQKRDRDQKSERGEKDNHAPSQSNHVKGDRDAGDSGAGGHGHGKGGKK